MEQMEQLSEMERGILPIHGKTCWKNLVIITLVIVVLDHGWGWARLGSATAILRPV